ncbi:hypothetical protein BY458DRAFT_521523 [Sporodiniella umbellata]|nr:hypothetical protein BY458DRAFT_521523 [Sporodiniella umbellata]
MGQVKSKENHQSSASDKKSHLSKQEIQALRHKVKPKNQPIGPEDFKQTVKEYVPSVSSQDDVFLEQLYSAFKGNGQKRALDFEEFVEGLGIFMKGSPQEKLSLSFRLYDVDHDGYLTKPELERVSLKLASAFSKEDRTAEIKEMVDQLFKDFDVDNDERLSFEEYKLSAMKEPLMIDFLEEFLDEHHITTSPYKRSKVELLERISPERRLSRPTSMTSLDAALRAMH